MLGTENCERKNQYESVHAAKEQIQRIHKRLTVKLRIYKCPYCYYFHLTSKAKFAPIEGGGISKDPDEKKRLTPYKRERINKNFDFDD